MTLLAEAKVQGSHESGRGQPRDRWPS